MSHPVIIQGGMGAGVSNWLLANRVASKGQIGLVSGTALDLILSWRLQLGDPGGHMRRALEHFPDRDMARRVLDGSFISGGKAPGTPFKPNPKFTIDPTRKLLDLTVVSNFVEVFLAKQGHDGKIGINYLEKIQMPNPASIYGAMLASVDYVFMGAGIPREIPGIIDKLTVHEDVTLKPTVIGEQSDDSYKIEFSPREHMGVELPELKRPSFIAIIASTVLALTLARKSTGRVDGFVVEGPRAGGHNAQPRGDMKLNDKGEPIYGPKDDVNIEGIKKLGLPFWLAGTYGSPERLVEALELGAQGIQVGTAFAFCRESGLRDDLKQRLIEKAVNGEAEVITDPMVSPTGFPFKVARLEGTNSEPQVYSERKRVCDLGFLRHLYRRDDGKVGYRCPSEPVESYVKKGGVESDTVGRKCLCNGLMANIGLAQCRGNGYVEKPLVTAGCDLKYITHFVKDPSDTYSAEDVIDYLLEQYQPSS